MWILFQPFFIICILTYLHVNTHKKRSHICGVLLPEKQLRDTKSQVLFFSLYFVEYLSLFL